MRRFVLIFFVLPILAGCASQHEASVKRSIDAVVLDESQRQKVLDAIQAGESPDDALAKASDGPKTSAPVPK